MEFTFKSTFSTSMKVFVVFYHAALLKRNLTYSEIEKY